MKVCRVARFSLMRTEKTMKIYTFSFQVSTLDESAWTWSETRKEFYLHQYEAEHPDLDFNNEEVLKQFTTAVGKWMAAGAGGIRYVISLFSHPYIIILTH